MPSLGGRKPINSVVDGACRHRALRSTSPVQLRRSRGRPFLSRFRGGEPGISVTLCHLKPLPEGRSGGPGMRDMTPALAWLLAACASAMALVSEGSDGSAPAGNQNAAQKNTEAVMQGSHRFGLPSPLPRHAGAIRIATYNMLNFFDGV